MPRGSVADALRIFRMEALAAARDRHTLLYAVLVPLLVYPLLFFGMAQWIVYRKGVEERTVVRVALLEGALAPPLEGRLSEVTGLKIEKETAPEGLPPIERAQALFAGERVDIALAKAEGPGLSLYYDSGSELSLSGRRRVERALESCREKSRTMAATEKGLDPASLEAIALRKEDLASAEETGRRVLGAMLPIFLLLMSVSGAFYLAVDVTAGEKERKTAETTLLLPVPGRAVFLGKFLAVLGAGGLACALNLGSMLIASRAFFEGSAAGLSVRLPAASVALVLLVALLFLALAASLLLGVALLARSFREGQSYATPLFTLLILLPILASQPGTRLTAGTALVPVVNAALAMREALEGSIQTGPFLLALLALAAQGALGFAFAERLHAQAALHLAEESVPFSRILEFLRPKEGKA